MKNKFKKAMGKGKLFFFFLFSAWAAATLERYLGTSVPNKVRNFLWRACKEAIPTEESLCQGRIFLEDNCEYCDNSSEDVLHSLWNCPALSPVCVGLFLNLVFFATTDISIIFWIFFSTLKRRKKIWNYSPCWFGLFGTVETWYVPNLPSHPISFPDTAGLCPE